jgi:hypothetical protein
MMDFEILERPAVLATPAVATENERPEFVIFRGIKVNPSSLRK